MFRRMGKILLVLCCISTMSANAESYYYDRKGNSVATPDTYLASTALDGVTLGIGAFNGIQDMHVSKEGNLYIADSGNNRVVIIGTDNTVTKVVDSLSDGENVIDLANPQGVFYKDGKLYICNTGSQEVLVADDYGKLVRRYGRPDSASLPKGTEYKPSKVVVNAAGSIFVQATGVYQGLVQYNAEGEFVNFFGATKVEVTPSIVLQNIWKNLFSEEQREGLVRTISSELSNVFIDSEDFIFTSTAAVNTKQVRRLNAAGENILKYPGYDDTSLFTSGYDRNNFGDQEFDYSKGQLVVSQIRDIHLDADGVLSVLDSVRGKVLQYDMQLNPLCIFGGEGEQLGYFKNAVALEKRGDTYLVADADKNTITLMEPTGYVRQIRQAFSRYQQGDYTGSVDEWQKILSYNPSFTIAYQSIGRALLQEGKTKEALEYLREGDDRYYYSMAMQEYRRDFIRNNWMWLLPVVIFVIVGLFFGLRWLKKWLMAANR